MRLLRWRKLRLSEMALCVLGWFFGLGFDLFAGCGRKWFEMVKNGLKRLEKYQKVPESTLRTLMHTKLSVYGSIGFGRFGCF